MTGRAQAWAVAEHGPSDLLAITEVTVPEPGPGEMVLEVEAAALNPLDVKIMTGAMKAVMPVALPYVPGSDVCGRLTAVGDGVEGLRVGDRVVASTWSGALARRCLLPASAHVVRVPEGAPAADLAALPMAGLTALDILRHLGDVEGRTLAIMGATGGVGLALTQIASRRGARVIGSGRAGDAELLTANGATEAVDYAASDFVSAVRRTHSAGVDVLVDLVTMFDALLHSAEAVRDGGVLVSTLFGPEPKAFGDRISIVYQRLAAQRGDLQHLVDLYAAGDLRPNVSRTFPFEAAPEAYRALQHDHVQGKLAVVLKS